MNQLKPSVCIDAVFEGLPVDKAIQQVQAAGINAFEFWGWWDRDLGVIEAARDQAGLDISACCTKFISLVDSAARNQYLEGLEQSIQAAKRLKCKTLISQVGDAIPGVSRDDQHASLVDGLREAASMLEAAGITLVIEPLNELIDHQGYYLVRSEEAFQIIDQVGSPNVKVVFDIYHQQISEGQLIANITSNIDKIAHFHAAGNPGRHELTRGELHYPSIFDAIAATDYSGFVGLEYWPVGDASTGLREVADWFAE
ncbi:TIM barrel protein [Rubripirellula sp.]|jgi:hydroxypyruvate isomerase|nr:TIM barrel protein [Rubripirellula sp.]MDB4634348.1 TIM barrel protein [Rubripirellula sp.]MDC0288083.1 TIM barrel protein [Rubripirellula sp.]